MKHTFKLISSVLLAGLFVVTACTDMDDIDDIINGARELERVKYSIQVDVNDPALGSVTVEPRSVVDSGSTVVITATPNEGCDFLYWMTDEDERRFQNPLEFMATRSATYIAYFSSSHDTPQYTITANSNDPTMGYATVTPDGAVDSGLTVTLTAIAYSGYRFVHWILPSGNTSSNNPLVVEVGSNAIYTAVFEVGTQENSHSAIFDNAPLDISGYSDFQTNGEGIWLAQFASYAEGTSVHLPYLVMWMQGDATSNFAINVDYGAIELYKDTYYEDNQGNQYGDWQYYATDNMSCTALDMTSLTVSFNGSYTMFDLGDIVNGAEAPAECTHKTLSITVNNATFTISSKKAPLRKLRVK